MDGAFSGLLVESYLRTVGNPPAFVEPGRPASASWLYNEASYCVLAHNTDADPRFIYATGRHLCDRSAQRCFEYSWDEFVGLPSRPSAEAPDRDERQRLLDTVGRHGFTTGYTGLRVGKSGRRFRIEGGIVW